MIFFLFLVVLLLVLVLVLLHSCLVVCTKSDVVIAIDLYSALVMVIDQPVLANANANVNVMVVATVTDPTDAVSLAECYSYPWELRCCYGMT